MINPFVILLQETQHMLFQLAAAFAGDDLDLLGLCAEGLFHNPLQCPLQPPAVGIDIM